MTKNRYKFTFGEKKLTLTTDKDNLYMEEVEKIAREKYQAIKAKMPQADDETLAIVLAINCLSTQLGREKAFAAMEEELRGYQAGRRLKKQSNQTSLFEDEVK